MKTRKKLSSPMILVIVFAVVLVAALVLARLDLVQDNYDGGIGAQMDFVKENYDTVLVEYDGGEIAKKDIMASFYSVYSYYSQLASSFGITVDAETEQSFVEDAVKMELEARAIAKEFDNRGLTLDVTEEEMKAEADDLYAQNYEYAYANAAVDNESLRDAYTELTMYSQGMIYDVMYNVVANSYKASKMQESVYAEIPELTEEELKGAYDEQLAADEETYSASPTAIEDAMTTEGNLVLWMPEGYRTVKHVLVMPEDEIMANVRNTRTALQTAQGELASLEQELADLNDDDAEAEAEAEATEEPRTADDIQADIDAKAAEIPALEQAVTDAETACLAAVQTKLDEIYAKLEAGEDVDAVIAEYGEDPGMQSEPCMSSGYYVAANSTTWDPKFTAGAMMLENIGDYSETPVISSSGVHIIIYNSDVTPGAVALENVREELYDNTLTAKRAEHFTAKVTEWVEALNPVYHLDRWAN